MPKLRHRGPGRPEDVPTQVHEPAAPPPGAPIGEPPPGRDFWPWLLVLLVLVVAGLGAAWFATRSSGSSSASSTAQTTAAATPAPPKPKPKTRQTTTAGTTEVAVPSVTGEQAPAALKQLRAIGLTGDVTSVYSKKPEATVVGQSPSAGTHVARGSTISLNVSKGGRPVPVPDLVGQRKSDAVATLQAAGLEPDVATVPSSQPEGTVVAQHPNAGAKVSQGDGVRINVSGGRSTGSSAPATTQATTQATATVPDVSGQKLPDARKAIRDAGLVTELKHVPSDLPKDTVVAQSPSAGTTGSPGDHVYVTVSEGRPKTNEKPPKEPKQATASATVPYVVDDAEPPARKELESAGFKVEVVHQDTSDQMKDGTVLSQDPAGGSQAPAGSTVTIDVGRYSG